MASWVIGDVHGCAYTLRSLVENQIGLSRSDTLYLLGDYVDKGPRAGMVFDYLLGLLREGYRVVALRGNHEENLLSVLDEGDPAYFTAYVEVIGKNRELLRNGKLLPEHEAFLRQMPYYAELDSFILVHASVKPGPDFSHKSYLLEQYEVQTTREQMEGKRLVRGHKPHYINDIRAAIDSGADVIPLDNGCVYHKKHKLLDYTQLGSLCAFCLDDSTLKLQANREDLYPLTDL